MLHLFWNIYLHLGHFWGFYAGQSSSTMERAPIIRQGRQGRRGTHVPDVDAGIPAAGDDDAITKAKFGASGRVWQGLGLGFTWFHMISHGFTWFHMV